ncbi:MAG: VanW family protein [Propioniciclava sp.]
MNIESTTRKHRRGPLIAGVVGAGALLLLGGAYGVAYARSGQTLPPEASIEGVSVGGMTEADAAAAVTEAFAARADAEVTVFSGEEEITRTPQEWGVSLDVAGSVEVAMPGKSLNPATIWYSLTGGENTPAVITFDPDAVEAGAAELEKLVNSEPENAAVTVKKAEPTLTEGVDGAELNREATREALARGFLHQDRIEAVVEVVEPDITTGEAQTALDEVATPALSGPVTLRADGKSVEVTPAMVGAALTFEPADGLLKPVLDPDTLAKQAKKALRGFGLTEPKDARVKISGGKPVVVPSTDGMGVTKDELLRAVSESMTTTGDRAVDVTITEVEAEFTTEEAKNSGVKEIIGEFSTTFPATAYRVNNIGKSSKLINNTFLKPGEAFSMNKALGPRTLANGWMAGGAIDGGRVVQRMGGGISQTTTTLFNAIFFAGLEDIYHKPHSLYFSRYPMGREATLDYYSVDMKFRNNTDHGVVIQAFTNDPPVGGTGKVTVRIWSTKIYDIKATEPERSNFRSGGATIHDDSAVCSPQSAMTGFTVDYKRLFYQKGKLVRTEPFTWTYNSLTPVVCTNPNARADRIER